LAVCVAIERVKTDRRVLAAGCKTEEGISACRSVEVRVSSAWFWKNRSSCWQKRKPDKCERDEDQGEG
jgi:hypothetical protein